MYGYVFVLDMNLLYIVYLLIKSSVGAAYSYYSILL